MMSRIWCHLGGAASALPMCRHWRLRTLAAAEGQSSSTRLQQLRTNYMTVNHQVAMQRQWAPQWGHLGMGPFLVVKA